MGSAKCAICGLKFGVDVAGIACKHALSSCQGRQDYLGSGVSGMLSRKKIEEYRGKVAVIEWLKMNFLAF